MRPFIIDVISWTPILTILPESFPDIFLSGHSFLQVSENKCLFLGGYNTLLAKHDDTPTDTLIQLVFGSSAVSDIKAISLGCGPVAQASLLLTPEDDVFIVAGGTQERWALVSKYTAPGVPCDLEVKKKCLLVNNPECYLQDTVNWLGCDGPCNRWFHSPCLLMSHEQFIEASSRRKWFCNRSDCKK